MTRSNEVKFIGHLIPGEPDWLAARSRAVGGSEIAAVLGLSPWESRFSLWHRKMGLASPVAETDEMYWGKLLEATIREEFYRRHVHEERWDMEVGGSWRHAKRAWQIAAPDALLYPSDANGSVEVLEIKTSRSGDGWGEEGTDEIPVYYRAQVLWYLDTLGLDHAHVAVLIAGSEYREYQVDASPDEAQLMRDAAEEFVATLHTNQRPAIDSHDATYQVVRELHPDIEDMAVEVPANIAAPYLAAIINHKEAAAEKQRAASVLADFMGDARRAYWAGEQIAMRVPGRGPDSAPSLRHTPTKATGQKVDAA